MLSMNLRNLAALIRHELGHGRQLRLETQVNMAARLQSLAEDAEILERAVVPPAVRANADLSNVVPISEAGNWRAR